VLSRPGFDKKLDLMSPLKIRVLLRWAATRLGGRYESSSQGSLGESAAHSEAWRERREENRNIRGFQDDTRRLQRGVRQELTESTG